MKNTHDLQDPYTCTRLTISISHRSNTLNICCLWINGTWNICNRTVKKVTTLSLALTTSGNIFPGQVIYLYCITLSSINYDTQKMSPRFCALYIPQTLLYMCMYYYVFNAFIAKLYIDSSKQILIRASLLFAERGIQGRKFTRLGYNTGFK